MAMEIFRLFGSIFVDNEKANESISKTDEKAESLGHKFASGAKTAAKWGAALTGAAVGIGTAMLASAKSTAANLDTIDKGSKRMKVSTTYYQQLQHAVGLCGVEMSVMEKAAKKLEGTDLTLDDALESIMSYATETERTQAAIDLFGESIAYQMSPLLLETAESFGAMKQEASDLGLVMSEDSVAAGAKMNDTISKVEESIDSIKTEIGIALLPTIQSVLDWVVEHMPEIQKWIQDTITNVEGFFTDLKGFMDQFGISWGSVFAGMAIATSVATGSITWKIGLVMAAVVTAIELLNKFFGMADEYNRQIEEKGAEVVPIQGDSGAVVGDMILPAGTLPKFPEQIQAENISNWTEGRLGGKAGGFDQGGVLERGQIGILEGYGAEAVVPLERNKEWIAKVAQDMQGALGGSAVEAKLDRLIELLERGNQIYLDGRTLVGGIMDEMVDGLNGYNMVQGRVS